MGRSRDQALRNGVWVSPSGPSGHLPMNGEEQRFSPSGPSGHLPMNGEEQEALRTGLGQPLRPFGPPPHEWGGAELSPSGRHELGGAGRGGKHSDRDLRGASLT